MGREFGQQTMYSQEVLGDIDSEVRRFITKGYDLALQILKDHRDILEEMSESLLIRETLEMADINRLMRGEKIVTEEEKTEYQERIRKEKEAIAQGKHSKVKSTVQEEAGTKRPDDQPGVEPVPQGT